MVITQRDIEITAGILWNGAAKSADMCPDVAAYDFTQLAVKYSALSLLFCGRHDDADLLFSWLKESARAMADHYYNIQAEAA